MPSAVNGSISPNSLAWLSRLLQAGDSFYPTGSYAHSLGLEGMIQEGVVRDRESLRAFLLNSTLPALAQADLPLVAHAWRALEQPDWLKIGELSSLASALKTAREIRTASENIGRQRAELAAALHPDSVASRYLTQVTARGWPFSASISAAVEARAVGAPLDAALIGSSYATLSAVLAAAMKLLRIGQNGAQSLLAELLAQVPALIEHAKNVEREEIGWFNPWLDIASARHEQADARMFIS